MVRRPRPPLHMVARRVLAPLGIVLSLAALATGFYFWRVTGSPFRMPYQVNRSTYAVAPYFMWQSPRPEPVYRHPAMHDFYMHNELDFYQLSRNPLGMLAVIIVKFIHLWMFYLGPLLTLPLVMVIATLPVGFSWRSISRATRFLLAAAVARFWGPRLRSVFLPTLRRSTHVRDPRSAALALRRLRQWEWHGQPSGQFLARALPLGCALLLIVRWCAGPLRLPLTPEWPPTWYNAKVVKTDRARMLAQLQALPQ